MKLKKIALVVGLCSMVYAFGGQPVSASAKEDVEQVAAVLPEASPSAEESEPAAETPKVTESSEKEEKKDSSGKDTNKKDTKKKDENKKDTKKKDTKKKDTKQKDTKKKDTKQKQEEKTPYTKSELRLMASIINCEAGAECYQGKLAVGIVVMNRIKSKNFPNTLKGVIYEKNQFSPVRNGMLKKKLSQYDKGQIKSAQWKSCISAAKKTLSGQTTIIKQGKMKNMKGIHFFSVGLANAKFKLGGHKFK